jgi:hypothetical protein
VSTVLRISWIASTLLAAAPALAQYPPPPPPGATAPAQPAYVPPPQPAQPKKVLRLSGGVAFASAGAYCGYYSYWYPAYSCSAGYTATWPNVNLDFDLPVSRGVALTLGANVFWGSFEKNLDTTVWEPHVDVLVHGPPASAVGRLRLGAGVLVSSSDGTFNSVSRSSSSVGGTFRLGVGGSLLADKRVGIGLDAIFEAGWLNGYYVSTIQLLIGPELHF